MIKFGIYFVPSLLQGDLANQANKFTYYQVLLIITGLKLVSPYFLTIGGDCRVEKGSSKVV